MFLKYYAGSPAIVVRLISRFSLASSNRVALCMVRRLSTLLNRNVSIGVCRRILFEWLFRLIPQAII